VAVGRQEVDMIKHYSLGFRRGDFERFVNGETVKSLDARPNIREKKP
jgi:hypothetical protein